MRRPPGGTKAAKSTHHTTAKPKRPATHSESSNAPSGDLQAQLDQRTRELKEALEQQAATTEVLKLISSSAGELEPVFDAMTITSAGLAM